VSFSWGCAIEASSMVDRVNSQGTADLSLEALNSFAFFHISYRSPNEKELVI